LGPLSLVILPLQYKLNWKRLSCCNYIKHGLGRHCNYFSLLPHFFIVCSRFWSTFHRTFKPFYYRIPTSNFGVVAALHQEVLAWSLQDLATGGHTQLLSIPRRTSKTIDFT